MTTNKSRASATYFAPTGGMPAQTDLLTPTDRAIVTEAYTVIPRGVHGDIVTMRLPHWQATRVWVLAQPVSGFSTTFAQLLVELEAGGGSDAPEPQATVESVLFVMHGELELCIAGEVYVLRAGGYAYLPAGVSWTVKNSASTNAAEVDNKARFHWIRKAYDAVPGIDAPTAIVTHEQDVEPTVMAGSSGRWATTRFVDPDDVRHDMHVTIVSLQPGAVIPFLETHVMEHGLYVLQGKGVYRLNQDWVEVQAGDFMWLRAFCPQACYAGGSEPFRYLLYKDMHRHCQLGRA